MFGNYIHRRSKSEWQRLFKEWWTSARIFVQEHGELAAVIGFGVGIFMVLFYKAFTLVACLVMLAYLFIMLRAKE